MRLLPGRRIRTGSAEEGLNKGLEGLSQETLPNIVRIYFVGNTGRGCGWDAPLHSAAAASGGREHSVIWNCTPTLTATAEVARSEVEVCRAGDARLSM